MDKMLRMKKRIYMSVFILNAICLLSQVKNDSIKKEKSHWLEEVEVGAQRENPFGISRLNNVEGVRVFAGKKTEAVYVGELNANTAANNSRQLFSKVAGINIFENDGAGQQIGIGGRGLNPNRVSNFNTRQNGYDISADALGYPESYYTPPSDAIDRIEILRGAASLQYGTQFGGMINYRFKEAASVKKINGLFRQTGGSFGFFNSYNQLSGTIQKLSYFTFYQYKHYDGWRERSVLNSHNAFVKFNYRVSEKLILSAEYTYLNYLQQQPGGLSDKQFNKDPAFVNRFRNWFAVQWNLASISIDYKITETLRTQIMAFGLKARRNALGYLGRADRGDDTSAYRSLLRDDYLNAGLEARVLKRYTFLGQNSNWLSGIRIYKGNTERKQGDADKSNKASFSFLHPNDLENSSYVFPSSNAALFTENVFQITKNWNITPGLRFEYIHTEANGYYRLLNRDLAGNVLLDTKITDNRKNERCFLLAGIGTQFKINSSIELYGNFSQNYRSINFNDMRVSNPNFQVDPNLKDEKGFTGDLGIRGTLKNFLYFDFSLFWLEYKNRIGTIITYDSLNYTLIRSRTNISDSRNVGAECFAEIDWINLFLKNSKHRLSTFVNAAYIHARYINSEQSAFRDKKVEYVPDIILRSGITYAWKKLSFTLQHSYTSEQFSDATNAEKSSGGTYGIIPSYSVLDFSVKYEYKLIGMNAGINNLSNEVYFSRRAEGYPGPGILPSDPINFYLGVQVKF
jgi:Fe(3+) dicitrate transport protein